MSDFSSMLDNKIFNRFWLVVFICSGIGGLTVLGLVITGLVLLIRWLYNLGV